MRVISGECRGLRLKPVPGQETRPTTDRVKEAMFSILTPYLNEGIVLDLFAGTGALGIESLSRGMSRCVFVEQSQKAVQILQENIRHCRFLDRSQVICSSASRALQQLAAQNETFDCVLLDPPYEKQWGPNMVQEIQNLQLAKEHTIYMIEHVSKDTLPLSVGTAQLVKQSRYGDTTLSFYQEGKKSL